LEQCLRFIARHAYIQTAIHGSSFCPACKDAFFLIARNVLRIGALTVISQIIGTIGKVFITAIVGTTAYYILSSKYDSDLHGLAAPMLLTMIVSWTVSSMFMEVIGAAVDAMIQCYITGTLVLSHDS
jgi:choline transporter-like protein 2/4/5